jgi:hypothetical protein
VHTGLRYRFGVQLTYSYNPTGNYRAEGETKWYFEQNWLIESMTPTGPAQYIAGLDQWIQPFIIQGVAKNDLTLKDDDFVQYLVVAVQAAQPNPSPPPPAPQPTSDPNAPPKANSNVSYASAVLWTLGIGLAAGGVWEGYKYVRTHRRLRTA